MSERKLNVNAVLLIYELINNLNILWDILTVNIVFLDNATV